MQMGFHIHNSWAAARWPYIILWISNRIYFWIEIWSSWLDASSTGLNCAFQQHNLFNFIVKYVKFKRSLREPINFSSRNPFHFRCQWIIYWGKFSLFLGINSLNIIEDQSFSERNKVLWPIKMLSIYLYYAGATLTPYTPQSSSVTALESTQQW